MKKRKKILKGFGLLAVFIACFITNNVMALENDEIGVEVQYVYSDKEVDSNENIGVSYYAPGSYNGGAIPFGTDAPSSDWNLHTKGQYNGSGNSTYHDLYSNYRFTGVSKMNISLTPSTSMGHDVVFEVYKYVWLLSDKKVYSGVADWEYGKTKTTIVMLTNLDPDAKYYIKYIAPTYFTGSVYEGY